MYSERSYRVFKRTGLVSFAISFSLLVSSDLSAGPGTAATAGTGPARAKVQKIATERLKKYQVPAGSVFQARLVTDLDSATARVDDQVDATLAVAVNQDGTELIPAGSVVIGKVLDVTPASPRRPLGRIAIAFFVIQHFATGSRAAIETHSIVLQASAPVNEESAAGRRSKKRPIDVRSSPEQLLTLRLAEPLIVYIPK